MLKLSDFDYHLPKELIAQYPLKKRDDARLLVLDRKAGSIKHCNFGELESYLEPGDLLVLNNTKVLRCRLIGRRRTGGRVEVFLLNKKKSGLLSRRPGRIVGGRDSASGRNLEGASFEALIKPTRVKLQEQIIFNGGKTLGVIKGKREIGFNTADTEKIYSLGRMPLPPYIKRDVEKLDDSYYQTVYAKKAGAVAAPTAGLHFTPALLEEIKSSGVNIAELTLHVGVGTFKPVKSEDIRGHKMEEEFFEISKDSLKLIHQTHSSGKRIVAVGTTSCRALEANVIEKKQQGATDIFIYPGYKFKAVDCLLTNFHLPRTTLFMLVCAFCAAGASANLYGGAGIELAKKAYREAIESRYRFYSYGDAMLII